MGILYRVAEIQAESAQSGFNSVCTSIYSVPLGKQGCLSKPGAVRGINGGNRFNIFFHFGRKTINFGSLVLQLVLNDREPPENRSKSFKYLSK